MKLRLKFLWLCLFAFSTLQSVDVTYNSASPSTAQDERLSLGRRAIFVLNTTFNGTNNDFEGNGYIFTLPLTNDQVIVLNTTLAAGEVVMTDTILENFSPSHVNLNYLATINGNGKFSFGKNCLVRMCKDESLTYALRFYNGAILDGCGKTLTLGDNGQLLGDSMTLKNMTILIDQPTSGSSTTSVNGINASGVITFDNVRIICKHDWNLTLGVPAFI